MFGGGEDAVGPPAGGGSGSGAGTASCRVEGSAGLASRSPDQTEATSSICTGTGTGQFTSLASPAVKAGSPVVGRGAARSGIRVPTFVPVTQGSLHVSQKAIKRTALEATGLIPEAFLQGVHDTCPGRRSKRCKPPRRSCARRVKTRLTGREAPRRRFRAGTWSGDPTIERPAALEGAGGRGAGGGLDATTT